MCILWSYMCIYIYIYEDIVEGISYMWIEYANSVWKSLDRRQARSIEKSRGIQWRSTNRKGNSRFGRHRRRAWRQFQIDVIFSLYGIASWIISFQKYCFFKVEYYSKMLIYRIFQKIFVIFLIVYFSKLHIITIFKVYYESY